MKNFATAVLVAALIILSVAAKADQAPPVPGSGNSQGMQAVRAQIDQLRAQSRVSALDALTAASRTLLGQVVGQLAIARTPDVSAAVKTLDGRLSPGEAKAVVGISAALDRQIRQTMEAARSQMGGVGSPSGSSHRPGMDSGPGGNDQSSADAGMILLRLAVRPIGPPAFMRMGGPPGS